MRELIGEISGFAIEMVGGAGGFGARIDVEVAEGLLLDGGIEPFKRHRPLRRADVEGEAGMGCFGVDGAEKLPGENVFAFTEVQTHRIHFLLLKMYRTILHSW